jgi:hypothetical protein
VQQISSLVRRCLISVVFRSILQIRQLSPYLFLDLSGATLEWRQKGKKHGNSFTLSTVLLVKVVFTTDEKFVEDWYKCIDDTIGGGVGGLALGLGALSSGYALQTSASELTIPTTGMKKSGKFIGRNKSLRESK